MNTQELLIKAKAIIADPAHWTQGTYAKTDKGLRTDTVASDATCFCSIGACYKVTGTSLHDDEQVAQERISGAWTLLDKAADMYGGIVQVNDHYSHDLVLTMFDEAIRLAGEPQ